MTKEGERDTQKWVVENEYEPGYAYDRKGALARYFGVRGIPSSVLVDGFGNIVYRGHPGKITDADVERALTGALPSPAWTWPKGASRFREALLGGDIVGALEAADELGDDYVAIARARLEAVVGVVQGAHDEGDYLSAVRLGESVEKGLKGLPEAETVAAVLEAIESDPEKQRVLEGQRDLAKLIDRSIGVASRGKIDKLAEQIAELSQEYSGTIIAKQGDAFRKRLLERRP